MRYYPAPSTPLVTTLSTRDTQLQKRLTQKIQTLDAEIIERLAQQPTFALFVQQAFDTAFKALSSPIDLAATFINTVPIEPAQPSSAPGKRQEPSPPPDETPNAVLPSLLDAVTERIVLNTPASFATRDTRFHRSATGKPVEDLAADAFDRFLDSLAETLTTQFDAHLQAFWNTSFSAADTRTCKAWVNEKRLELMKAEIELLKIDGVIDTSAELLLMRVVRSPDAAARSTLQGYRPCAYGLAVKDPLATDIPLHGALIITTRDQDDDKVSQESEVSAPKVRDILPQANVGQVLLYLPTSGFEAFDSLASLDLELHRRLNSPVEFVDILALMNENDRPSGLAFHQQHNTRDQFRYLEQLESIFSYGTDSLCERAKADFTWMVTRYQRQADELDSFQLPASLDRVTQLARLFDAGAILVARQKKNAQRQLRQFLNAASADDKAQWEAAARDYAELLQQLFEEDALPSLSQFSDRTSLLSYSNEQLRRVLEAEYGLTTDPDEIKVHTKTYANRLTGSYVPGGKPHPSEPGTPLFTARTLTLTELALENIEWLDLNFTRFARLTDSDQQPYTALTVEQVKTLIRTLNIGDSYEQFLKARLISSQQAQATQQQYTEVMARQLRVDAREAKIASDFLTDRQDRGFNWVMSVLDGPVDDDQRRTVEEHRVIVNSLRLRGERVRGVLVFAAASQSIGSLVVYTPRSKTGRRFQEYADASAMHRDFINHSAWQDYLVERVELNAQPRIRSVLKGGARASVIALTRIAGNFLEEAYQTEASAVINDANAQTISTQETNLESAKTILTTAFDLATMVLPVKIMLPIGLARSMLSIIDAVEAAQVGDRAGAAESIVRAMGELVGAVIDGASAGARSAGKGIVRSRSNTLDPKLALNKKPEGVALLAGWEDQHIYARDIVEPGTYQAPQHFLLENSHWYSIRRDSDALVWRLKDPRRAPSAYPGAPLFRNAQGVWEIRSPHLGLRGGAPTPSAAESALMNLFPHLSLEDARRVFDSFVFPARREAELQVSLVQHLSLSTERLPVHAQYLSVSRERFTERLAGRDLPASLSAQPAGPTAGPSRAPAAPAPAPSPALDATLPPRTEWRKRPKHERFVDWGESFAADSIDAVPGLQGVWRTRDAAPGRALQEYIMIDNRYYPILPGIGNSAQQGARAVLVPSNHPCSTFPQFEQILRYLPFDQPRIAQYSPSLNTWLLAPRLPFSRSIVQYMGQIFTHFTPPTLKRLSAAFFDHANPTAMTTPGYGLLLRWLTDWRYWSAGTVSGDPLPGIPGDPLALLPRLPMKHNLNAWSLDLTRPFSMVRFRTDLVPATLIRTATLTPTPANLRNLMQALLRDMRYQIFDSADPTELIFRRQDRPTVYWMTIVGSYTRELSAQFHNPQAPTPASVARLGPNVRATVVAAQNDGQLIVLLGGVQLEGSSSISPFIFRP